MKQTDPSAIGGSRKSLPVRKARKVRKSAKKPAAQKKKVLDNNAEAELIRVFGER